MLQAAIFDMDGLLIDSEPLWWEAEIEVFGEVGIVLNELRCRETTGFRIDEIVDYWYQQYPWHTLSKQQVQNRLMQRLIERIYLRGEPKAGVAHALSFFQQKEVKVALASSSVYAIIDAVLDKLALRDVFQVVYSAEDEQYGKPHPGVYLTTAHKLAVIPRTCIALEDSVNGVVAAKAATMKCIAVPEHFPDHDARFVLADAILPSLTTIDNETWHSITAMR